MSRLEGRGEKGLGLGLGESEKQLQNAVGKLWSCLGDETKTVDETDDAKDGSPVASHWSVSSVCRRKEKVDLTREFFGKSPKDLLGALVLEETVGLDEDEIVGMVSNVLVSLVRIGHEQEESLSEFGDLDKEVVKVDREKVLDQVRRESEQVVTELLLPVLTAFLDRVSRKDAFEEAVGEGIEKTKDGEGKFTERLGKRDRVDGGERALQESWGSFQDLLDNDKIGHAS